MNIVSTSDRLLRSFLRTFDALRPPQNIFRDDSVKHTTVDLRTELTESVGSVIGAMHLGPGGLPKTNNQDAYRMLVDKEQAIIVLCDGCSGASNSEVGAKLLAGFVQEAFRVHATSEKSAEEIVAAVERTAIQRLRTVASLLAPSGSDARGSREDNESFFRQIVSSYFLATSIGAYCTPNGGFIWGRGDGVYGYYEEGTTHIEVVRSKNNFPPYMGYELLKEWPKDVAYKRMSVYKEFKRLPECIMVGTDGVEDLISCAGRKFPGSDEKIPAITDLLVDKKYIKSPSIIGDLLVRIQGVGQPEGAIAGRPTRATERLLRDDTTLVLLGKRIEASPVKPVASADPKSVLGLTLPPSQVGIPPKLECSPE
jgi:hypothetical protein